MHRSSRTVALALFAVPGMAAAQSPTPSVTGAIEAYVGIGNGSDVAPLAVGSVTRGRLRVEGRYGYEDEHTGSVFGGWEITRDARISLWLAPMLGAVFGRTSGVAPAVELEVASGRFTLYVESEYLIAAGDGDDFLFTWSTATWRLTDRVDAGLVVQRLRTFLTAPNVDRGATARVAIGPASVALYVYNPFGDARFGQLGVGWEF